MSDKDIIGIELNKSLTELHIRWCVLTSVYNYPVICVWLKPSSTPILYY